MRYLGSRPAGTWAGEGADRFVLQKRESVGLGQNPGRLRETVYRLRNGADQGPLLIWLLVGPPTEPEARSPSILIDELDAGGSADTVPAGSSHLRDCVTVSGHRGFLRDPGDFDTLVSSVPIREVGGFLLHLRRSDALQVITQVDSRCRHRPAI